MGSFSVSLGSTGRLHLLKESQNLRNHKQSSARLTLAGCYLQLEKQGEVDFEQLFAMHK